MDEICREGWRARKVFRVRLPPPTLIPFAAVLRGQDPDKESSNASMDFAGVNDTLWRREEVAVSIKVAAEWVAGMRISEGGRI